MKKNSLFLLNVAAVIQYYIGAFFYKMYSFFPSQIFVNKNILDKIVRDSVSVSRNLDVLTVEKYNYKIKLRIKGSDILVYNQIFINHEYKNVVELIARYNINVGVIFDAGSNIGLTTLYLKKYFNDAVVICLEPDKANFQQLKKNIEDNKLLSVHLLNEGLWYKSDLLEVDSSFRDGKDWSKRLIKTEGGQVPVYSLDDYVNRFSLISIDLLKIDIEGAEEFIFNDTFKIESLNIVRVIAIEPHDLFRIGSAILQILTKSGFNLYLSGELILGVNSRYIDER